MAAAVAMHSVLVSSGTKFRFARHHIAIPPSCRRLTTSRAIDRVELSGRSIHAQVSPTTTVIPTTGIEIESAALNGLAEELDHPDKSAAQVDSGGNGGAGSSNGRGGGGGGGGGGDGDQGEWNGGPEPGGGGGGDAWSGFLLLGLWDAFLRGWRSRVRTDPQFPFKVLTEEVIGVGACVVGDMASRPNFGLDELDFVFSTLVVGSILNFTLMYMLAPTSAGADISRLPAVFAGCPPGHMFEPGAYSLLDRAGTFLYKGALFAAVGFAAGLLGTAVSNLLLQARKRMDPGFALQNEPPPTLLNAATWALHMGVSSNLRYQAINGAEFVAAGMMSPALFKAAVFAARAANNVLGGTSFVVLARWTGSQRSDAGKKLLGGDPGSKVAEIDVGRQEREQDQERERH